MLQVEMGFELLQPDGSFDVDEQKPQEYCWNAKALFCNGVIKVDALGMEDRQISRMMIFTCVPHILDPNVGAGGKEQPMDRDKQKANHVGRDGNANEEY